MSNIAQYGDLTADQIKNLSDSGVIPAGTPAPIISVFATACKEHGLSPFRKEIYLVKYGSIYATIVGIDGTRKKAARTGQYAGIDDLKYDLQEDGSFKSTYTVKKSGKDPVTCTATVYRIMGGVRCPFTKTVVFDEFAAASKNPKFREMPYQMIGKIAESFALKMAFGDELGGLHIEEEDAAFEGVTIQAAEYRPAVAVDVEGLKDKIAECWTDAQIKLLYGSNPAYREYADFFTDRHNELVEMLANGQITEI